MKMLSRCGLMALGLLLAPLGVQAQASSEGWILALGWSPEYCDDHVGSKETQCIEEHYFLISGLRPDFRGGEPSSCKVGEGVTKERLNQLLYVIPNKTTLRQLWRDHGACSGLGIDEYFVQVDRAARRVVIPQAYLDGEHPLRVPAAELRQQFIQLNPGLDESAIRLNCKGRWLNEVQVCLDPGFGFRACGLHVEESCKDEVRLREIRSSRKSRRPKS